MLIVSVAATRISKMVQHGGLMPPGQHLCIVSFFGGKGWHCNPGSSLSTNVLATKGPACNCKRVPPAFCTKPVTSDFSNSHESILGCHGAGHGIEAEHAYKRGARLAGNGSTVQLGCGRIQVFGRAADGNWAFREGG